MHHTVDLVALLGGGTPRVVLPLVGCEGSSVKALTSGIEGVADIQAIKAFCMELMPYMTIRPERWELVESPTIANTRVN